MAENGISTSPAIKEISRGLQAVSERLNVAGDGRPRLFIFNDALVETDGTLEEAKRPTCTADEFPGYIWPKSADGRAIKETPVKENDHGMDTMRYGVMYLDGGGRTQIADSPW